MLSHINTLDTEALDKEDSAKGALVMEDMVSLETEVVITLERDLLMLIPIAMEDLEVSEAKEALEAMEGLAMEASTMDLEVTGILERDQQVKLLSLTHQLKKQPCHQLKKKKPH
jgi:DNA replication protein DnaD